jgi:cytochrome c556
MRKHRFSIFEYRGRKCVDIVPEKPDEGVRNGSHSHSRRDETMIRKLARWSAAAVVCTFSFLFVVGAVTAKPLAEPTSVHDIMAKGHAGKKSLFAQLKEGVKGEKWDDIAKAAKTLKTYGEDLGKNKVEKGDEASWKKLAEEYKKTTVAIAEGVEKKDQKAATKALETLGKSCKACHDVHK